MTGVPAAPAIATIDGLRLHLQAAINVELSTIPPYLYALYSIVDPASDAAKLIRSVVVEEMLHATLMANVLLGVGGTPRFYDRATVPTYPGPWPHRVPELMLRLRRCSTEHATQTFLEIERPIDVPPTDPAVQRGDVFDSQGHFYRALESALVSLDEQGGLFAAPQLDRQLTDPDGYHTVKFDSDATGGLIGVHNLDTALAAIDIPIHQGEGAVDHEFADTEHIELTHYAKFRRLVDGTAPIGTVFPAVDDPTRGNMPTEVRPVGEFADALYCYTMVLLDRLFTTERADDQRRSTIAAMYGVMSGMLAPVCRYMMTLPADDHTVWGPAFEFFEYTDPDAPETELRARASALGTTHPRLVPHLRHADRL
ncbi:MAG: ferritin-like protein [Actinomycetota bacterium]